MWALLTLAAAARLLLQMAAMPPYAGLDEIYHVGVLRFVAAEGRMPRMGEASMPRYLASSAAGDPAALPAFGVIGERWPDVVASRPRVLASRDTTSALRPYSGTNYEAQQPALYYRLAAPLARTAISPLTELRIWRLFSLTCALLIVICTAFIGRRLFGEAGLLAAAVLVSFPTWETLVVRASNDALACACLAAALAASIAGSASTRRCILEALLWAAAIAVKLYSWPVVIVLPLIWRSQRAAARRWLIVGGAIAIAAVLTIADLHSRTNNPLGLFAFDAPANAARAAVPIDYATMAKVFVATFAWTSGQHWDALRPAAIALYLLPIAAVIAAALLRHRRDPRRELLWCAAVLAAFAAAQVVNAAGYARIARASGSSLPAGGKEGWYWYALAPLVAAVVLGVVFKQLPRIASALLVAWIVAWDVVITEGALFHDYAGAASPAHGSMLFRWGPLAAPFTADLAHVAVGPLAGAAVSLRLIALAAVAVLAVAVLGRRARNGALPGNAAP